MNSEKFNLTHGHLLFRVAEVYPDFGCVDFTKGNVVASVINKSTWWLFVVRIYMLFRYTVIELLSPVDP